MWADLLLLLLAPKQFNDLKALLFHHVTILIIYTCGLLHQPPMGLYFMLAFQVQELTNPFLTNRWFLIECGMKESVWYVINGILVLVTFFVVRIVFGMVVCLRLHTKVPEWAWEKPGLVIALYGAWIFQSFQFYWFYYILLALVRFLLKGKKE